MTEFLITALVWTVVTLAYVKMRSSNSFIVDIIMWMIIGTTQAIAWDTGNEFMAILIPSYIIWNVIMDVKGGRLHVK